MEKEVLKKPTLVLMAGLPGVGKTTLAFALGRELRWAVLEKDLLKEPFLEAPEHKENFDEYTAGWAAYENSLKFTEDFLVKQQLSVILDTSLLHPFILERAKELTARSGAQLKIILCEVDEDTRQHRLRTRKTRISQTKAHLVPKEVAKQFEQLDPSSYKKIETKPSPETYVEEALTYVTEQEEARDRSVSTQYNDLDALVFFFYYCIQWLVVSVYTYMLLAFSCFVATQLGR